ncbi:MAG: type II toxin-antitoxin system HicA family toxin [Pirellulales bacterium]
MKSVSGKDLCSVLQRNGWELKRIRGSHHIFAKPNNPVILTVPVHGNKALKTGTLRRLMRDAALTEDDL